MVTSVLEEHFVPLDLTQSNNFNLCKQPEQDKNIIIDVLQIMIILS
jgi:hypothetical protein